VGVPTGNRRHYPEDEFVPKAPNWSAHQFTESIVCHKAHVARMRLSMPATSNYWVNDKTGDSLFVLTAEANAGMVKMLPPVLEHVRALMGECRVAVVFDRGGYSPKLFQQIQELWIYLSDTGGLSMAPASPPSAGRLRLVKS
jgi:hypothetical protein